MKTVMADDMRDYVKKNGKLIMVSLIAAVVCYGFLVFCGNIRIDTEELINHPGSKLGWLTIGRFGLALLKTVLGLSTHSVVKSGILFYLFFWAGANLITFGIFHFSGKKDFPYWIFMLLYVTSNIWCYQIYFSVQQAEVACAMLLLVIAAVISVQAFFETRGAASICRMVLSTVLLVFALGAYQALAAYYIAVCIVFFVAGLGNETSFAGGRNHKLLWGIAGLIFLFAVAYLCYHVIANTWFMATADYMEGQVGWGKYSVIDCVKNVLRTAKNLIVGIGPRNFSFYVPGALLTVISIVWQWKEKTKKERNLRFGLLIAALMGLLVTPFLMTIYMGEMLVTRSQFALPVVAAFLGMYAIDALHDLIKQRTWILNLCKLCVVLTIAIQCLYNARMAYTDDCRYQSDVAKTEVLLELLSEKNSGTLPEQPIVFVGYQEADMSKWCRRTEMYGWSFYEWDYSKENPTGATHRIVGFVQAYANQSLNEAASETEKRQAVKLAEQLADFPAADSVMVTDEFVVVRLSEVEERTALDWW